MEAGGEENGHCVSGEAKYIEISVHIVCSVSKNSVTLQGYSALLREKENYIMNDHTTEGAAGKNMTLVNRTLVRIKVLQIAFAYFQDADRDDSAEGSDPSSKMLSMPLWTSLLEKSYEDTYNLYLLLLDLVYELTRYAQTRIEEMQEHAKIMHNSFHANWRFVNNRFAQQLFENKTLRRGIAERNLGWDAAHESLSILYRQIVESPIYDAYMKSAESSYRSDKAVWKKIFSVLLTENEELGNALEELEIALDGRDWTVEADLVISYVAKTIKRFDEENGADQELLEIFQSDRNGGDELTNRGKERDFGKTLLESVILHSDEYEQRIVSCLKNWEKDRLSYMDMVILKVAIAEIMTFPKIELQVSMNEYIDIAREYSSDNSPMFINGMLEEVVSSLKRENKLYKAVVVE